MRHPRIAVLFVIVVLTMSSSGCFVDDEPVATIDVDILVLESGVLYNDKQEPLPYVDVDINIGQQGNLDWITYHESVRRTDESGRIRFSIDVEDLGYYQAVCWCMGAFGSGGVNVDVQGLTYTLSVVFD